MTTSYTEQARVLRDFEWLIHRQRQLSYSRYRLDKLICECTSEDERESAREKYSRCVERIILERSDNPVEWDIAWKINQNYYARTRRLKKRVSRIISNPLGSSFVTLTFKDDVFASTNEQTRRTYVQRFLKELSPDFVANIDFGKKKHREHYHAVILGVDLDFSEWQEKYGFVDVQRVRIDQNASVTDTTARLSKYVAKLSSHAIKETVEGHTLIYSRNTANKTRFASLVRLVPVDECDLLF